MRIDCAGAPRDLGFDQGRQLRDLLASACARETPWRRAALRLGVGDAASSRLVRDLVRHFPQQSEFLEGMARGAGVPYRWLAERIAATYAPGGPELVAEPLAVALAAPLSAVPRLARAVPVGSVVRHSRPDGGWPSVELTLPGLTAGLVGVNAGGLAVVGVTSAGCGPAEACAAPAALLVQDCLARFDSVAGARDWCIGRPAGGRASVLLCDAGGAVAAVAIDGAARRSLHLKDGLLVVGVEGPDLASRLRAAGSDEAARAAALGDRVAVVDPVGRRLGLLESGGPTLWWEPAEPAPEGA